MDRGLSRAYVEVLADRPAPTSGVGERLRRGGRRLACPASAVRRPHPFGRTRQPGPGREQIDLLLYDGFSRERVVGPVRDVVYSTPAPVVLFTWHLGPKMVAEVLENGAGRLLVEDCEGEELVSALEQVHRRAIVVSPDPGAEAVPAAGEWPGRSYGLTARESEETDRPRDEHGDDS